MVPPSSLLGVLVASFDVKGIIRRPFLFFAAGQHADYAEAHRLHGKRRRPIVGQDGQTDVAVAVDVRMDRDVRADEHHLGRVERILATELELQLKMLALV